MKFALAISISLLIPSAFAKSFHLLARRDHAPEKRNTEARIAARQEDPTATTVSTIGLLPNAGLLSTGTPALGGQSLTGHGPVIQPQPGNSAPGNDSSTNTTSETGIGNFTTTTAGSNHTTSTPTTPIVDNADTDSTNNEPSHLEVIDYQYTFQSRPRVDITVQYGAEHVTQTWEVRGDGRIHLVQDMDVILPAKTSSIPSMPMGTGTSSVNGTGSLEGSMFPQSSATDGGSASSSSLPSGTGTPPRQERPSGARPGFTGPKLRARREQIK